MKQLLNDISTITTIPIHNLKNLASQSNNVISHYIAEMSRDGLTECTVDIGIGTLCIKFIDDSLKYRFIPSRVLEKSIVQAYTTKEGNLVKLVEESLATRITTNYKDLFQ